MKTQAERDLDRTYLAVISSLLGAPFLIVLGFLVIAALGCAMATDPKTGLKATTFGQGLVTVEHPDGTRVTAESRGLSDNFAAGLVGRVVDAAASVFGGGPPAPVNVTLPPITLPPITIEAGASARGEP